MLKNINRKFFSKIGLNYTFLGIFAIIMQILITAILANVYPALLMNTNTSSIVAAICNYILPLPIFLYLMNRLEKQEISSNKVSIKKFIKYVAITMVLMWIGNMIGLLVTETIGHIIQSPIENPIVETINSSSIYLNLLLMVIAAPIFEELFFRKLLIDRTIKYGKGISILLSATLFGLFHGNLNQFFYTFLMGGFFAYVYIKTGKITYTIALHLIINLLGSVISVLIGTSATNVANLATQASAIDLGIVIIYLLFYIIMFIIGVIAILKNTDKLKILKDTLIEKPYTTTFINIGMICFYIYAVYIFLM